MSLSGNHRGVAAILVLSKGTKIVGVGFIFLIIMGVGYREFVKKNRDRYHELCVEEVILKRCVEEKQQEVSHTGVYRDQLVVIGQHLAQILKEWPSQDEMAGILDDLSKIGISSGLKVASFVPKSEVSHDFYIELPIEITLIGQFRQLYHFLNRVAQMNRVITIHHLAIEQQFAEKSLAPTGDILRMRLLAKIYRYPTT